MVALRKKNRKGDVWTCEICRDFMNFPRQLSNVCSIADPHVISEKKFYMVGEFFSFSVQSLRVMRCEASSLSPSSSSSSSFVLLVLNGQIRISFESRVETSVPREIGCPIWEICWRCFGCARVLS